MKFDPNKWDLLKIANMDQIDYEKYFAGSSLTRAKKNGLKRNALISLVVNKHPELEKTIAKLKQENIPVLNETISQLKNFSIENVEYPKSTL